MSRRDQDIRDAILAELPGDLVTVPLSQIEGRLQAEGVSAYAHARTALRPAS